jgi:dienelactone hydrolase
MREDIEFDAEGTTLRGWFYRCSPSEGSSAAAPCVVVQHGFAATIEMKLAEYAEVFAAAGLHVLVYDHPGFGISDAAAGKPRQEIDPWEQVRGIQHAITYAQTRPEVDASRIGVWGSSYGGANAYTVASIDRRVTCVVGQVPLISGRRNFETLVRVDFWQATWDMLAADRATRAAGGEPIVLPVVAEDPLAQSALPTPDSYEFFHRFEGTSTFRNEVTLRSLEHFYGYEPGENLKRIAPTPLLMVVAPHDRLAPGEWATAAFETAAAPKKLVLLPGGHFDAYEGEGFAISSSAARDWFAEHLLRGASTRTAAGVA